jgi:hypothetical protein
MSVEAWTLPRRVVDENRADPRSQVVGADELGHGKVAERCHFVVDPCRAGDWAARGLVMVRGSLPTFAANLTLIYEEDGPGRCIRILMDER